MTTTAQRCQFCSRDVDGGRGTYGPAVAPVCFECWVTDVEGRKRRAYLQWRLKRLQVQHKELTDERTECEEMIKAITREFNGKERFNEQVPADFDEEECDDEDC